MKSFYCRICHSRLHITLCNLGSTPLANSFLTKADLKKKENKYELRVFFCKKCYLFQLPNLKIEKKIFSNYDYFSSYSTSFLEHVNKYKKKITKFVPISKKDKICEIASNDGYLLNFFKKDKFINILGVEPAKNIAKIANDKGIKTLNNFFTHKFSKQLVNKYGKFKLIICNNVIAHVPNIKDFFLGLKDLLDQNGVITLEFPHVLNMIDKKQFDTIYHEHFSYISVFALEFLLKKTSLKLFKVEKIKTHGGSLRAYIKFNKNKKFKIEKNVKLIKNNEISSGIFNTKNFIYFQNAINSLKNKFLIFLKKCKLDNKKIICYGAPAKGNTLLNYFSINSDFIKTTYDKNPHKVGKYLPGSKILIKSTKDLNNIKPDYIIILPWNIKNEIISFLKKKKNLNKTKYITLVPSFKIFK